MSNNIEFGVVNGLHNSLRRDTSSEEMFSSEEIARQNRQALAEKVALFKKDWFGNKAMSSILTRDPFANNCQLEPVDSEEKLDQAIERCVKAAFGNKHAKEHEEFLRTLPSNDPAYRHPEVLARLKHNGLIQSVDNFLVPKDAKRYELHLAHLKEISSPDF